MTGRFWRRVLDTLDRTFGPLCDQCGARGGVYLWNDRHGDKLRLCRACTHRQ